MKIDVIGSGSKGNAYRVDIGDTTLLIECGLPFKELRKKLKFKLYEIDACLVTHEHMDHAKSAKELMLAGIDCYMTEGTAKALKLEESYWLKKFAKIDNNYTHILINDVSVLPFESVHDVSEPVNFLISSFNTNEKLMFITDTAYIKYKIAKDIDVLCIECNYIKKNIDENVKNGKLNANLRNRIVKNHMSLETALEAIKNVKFTKLKRVYALHLSDSNSDEKKILEELQKVTGVPVIVC